MRRTIRSRLSTSEAPPHLGKYIGVAQPRQGSVVLPAAGGARRLEGAQKLLVHSDRILSLQDVWVTFFSMRLSYARPCTMCFTKMPGVWMPSGSSWPGSTSCSTSAMVWRAAVAITGLKLREVLRYTRL